jgi:hypothetical protein
MLCLTIFYYITGMPCLKISLIEIYPYLERSCCISLQVVLKIEKSGTYKTSVKLRTSNLTTFGLLGY